MEIAKKYISLSDSVQIVYEHTVETNQRHALDKFLEDVGDDLCRVGNFAPRLVENAGVVCNVSGIPD